MPDLPDRIREFYAEAALSPEAIDRIAAGARRARRERTAVWGTLAAAAAVALLVWIGTSRSTAKMTPETVGEQVRAFFTQPDPQLAYASPNPGEVRKWLAAQRGPSNVKIPPGLQGKATVGCEILGSGEQRIFIICFIESESRNAFPGTVNQANIPPVIVHLVLTSKQAFASLPPTSGPTFAMRGGWASAAWTDDTHVYLLTTDAGFEPLRRALKT